MHGLRCVMWGLFVLSAVYGSGGCGGGSAGTGTGDDGSLRIAGTVRETTGAPVPGATVTVLESGASDITDDQGFFEIETAVESETLTIEVSSGDKSAFTTVTAPADGGSLVLEIKVNPLFDEVEADTLAVRSKIVGYCDSFFENRRAILQTVRVPPGTSCTAKVTVRAGDLPLAHVPIAIQYRRCEPGSRWFTAALGATMTGSNLGVGQVSFLFYDDEEHCLYRTVAPYEVESLAALETEIHSFTYQRHAAD